MKPLCLILSIGLFITGLAKAQTNSSTTAPKSTTTSSSATQTTSTNRQQELYDQYHGISKKSTPAATATSTPVATSTPESTPRPTPSAPVASRPVRQNEPKSEITGTRLPSQAGVISENASFRIGLRGGVTYPIYLEQTAGIDPAVGFVGGLVMQFGRGKLSFQPEINYSRITQNVSGFSLGSTKVATDQIVVPLLLKIASGSFDGNRFFLNIGPYGAYLSSIAFNGVKQEITGSQGRFSFGAAAGVGAMLKAGPGHFTIEVRGLYGLGNSADGFNTDSKTILGEGTLGYVFPLGR